jgi:alginate O-acetyltransferase complex protein AlgI
MLFNSASFLIFFTVFLFIYFAVPARFRNLLLLIASYYFYMSWEPLFGILILFATGITYLSARLLGKYKSEKTRKIIVWTTLTISIGLLFFFKYFNFFNESFTLIFNALKIPYSVPYLNILLPVGISFYTFETISYVLDVYYEIRDPEIEFDKYALYISYFPKLLAGPIERSTTLLPQFHSNPSFDSRVVIADRLSVLIAPVYNHPGGYEAITLLFTTYLFAFQVYCDFSGYTDIALGVSKIMGYELTDNFDHPYASKNVSEFWRRWHISLSTWLRDYLYTPIMYAKKHWGAYALIYASFITFLLCGLWHGAKWSFVAFGLFQGIAIAFEVLTKNQRRWAAAKIPNFIYNNLSMVLTFNFIVFSYIFFRANNMTDAFIIVRKIFLFQWDAKMLLNYLSYFTLGKLGFNVLLLMLFIFLDKPLSKKIKAESQFLPGFSLSDPLLYSFLLVAVLLFGYYGNVEFIYFQF